MHYWWLLFLSQPLVVYLDGPGFYGAGIPFIISFGIISYFIYHIKIANIKNFIKENKNIIIACLVLSLISIIVGHYSGYWTSLGYHFFNFDLILLPILVLYNNKFHFLISYPLTFISLFIVDFTGAGIYGHWAGNFWFGVGGAGFHDGLFIGPMTTLLAAFTVYRLKIILTKYNLFSTRKVKIS